MSDERDVTSSEHDAALILAQRAEQAEAEVERLRAELQREIEIGDSTMKIGEHWAKQSLKSKAWARAWKQAAKAADHAYQVEHNAVNYWYQRAMAAEAEANQLRGEVGRLDRSIRRVVAGYARHAGDCALHFGSHTCDCGLDEFILGGEE